ncbi:MAG TPA: histidine kinase [Puia sp.]|nr:histidine kinase [Puia sp.]
MKFFWKYLFPPLYGLVVYVTIRLLLDTVTGMRWWRRDWQINAEDLVACLVFSYIFMFVFRRLLRRFDKKWPATDFSSRRILRELFYVVLMNVILQNVMLTTYTASTDDGLQWFDVVDINTVPLLYSLILYGVVRSNTFLKAHIASRIQLEKITNDQLQTELKFLKAQYHPHFLFNALNTIYFQMDEDIAAAKKSVEKFSELLRYQLYDQNATVPVSQEIHYLQNFIQLAQTRSSEKLQLQTHFDDHLNGQQVYPLLFLPLVENAFKYVGGDYHLAISVAVHDNRIEMQVDNGIPPDVPEPGETRKGIGLENLRRRLELLYPGKHTFTTNKTPESFTAALTLQYH